MCIRIKLKPNKNMLMIMDKFDINKFIRMHIAQHTCTHAHTPSSFTKIVLLFIVVFIAPQIQCIVYSICMHGRLCVCSTCAHSGLCFSDWILNAMGESNHSSWYGLFVRYVIQSLNFYYWMNLSTSKNNNKRNFSWSNVLYYYYLLFVFYFIWPKQNLNWNGYGDGLKFHGRSAVTIAMVFVWHCTHSESFGWILGG